jgi:hypothetical protein
MNCARVRAVNDRLGAANGLCLSRRCTYTRAQEVRHTITYHRDRSSVPNQDDRAGVDPLEPIAPGRRARDRRQSDPRAV